MSRSMLLAKAAAILGRQVFDWQLSYFLKNGYVSKPSQRIGNAYLFDQEHLEQLVQAADLHTRSRKAVAS
jgi:hypothetical protein